MDRRLQPQSVAPSHVEFGHDNGSEQPALSFAGFRLEEDGSLFRGETLFHLPPRELAALRLLLANAGQIVTSSELKKALWGNVHVTADSVPKCLSSLRARLRPDQSIQTVYKRGYRLLAQVRPLYVTSVEDLPRLAIAPFSSATGVPEHLGSAIAEEAIARLCNAPRPLASILARDSVFTLALRGLTAQQIGASLHADLVLAGTLRSFASHLRLRMEMIRVADGVQIWVEDLLVEQDHVAGIDSDLASRLDSRLNTRRADSWRSCLRDQRQSLPAVHGAGGAAVTETARPIISSTPYSADGLQISAVVNSTVPGPSASPRREAYDIYLRGHHEWQTLERHRMQDGLRHLTHATELDPSLVAAKVDLVQLCITQSLLGYMPPTLAANLIRDTAESIPDFPSGAESILPALALVSLHFDRNLPAALHALARSSHLPHDSWIARVRAMVALSRHCFAEAIALLRAAIQQDPFSPWLHSRLAWALHLAGHAGESVEQSEHALRLFPGHEAPAIYGSTILAFNGDTSRAVHVADDLVQRQPHFDLAASVHAYAVACAGRAPEARAILERQQWLGRERFVMKSFTAAASLVLGDRDAALAALNVSNNDRCPWFFQMLADPRLKPLHGDPQFEELRAILPRMEAAARQNG